MYWAYHAWARFMKQVNGIGTHVVSAQDLSEIRKDKGSPALGQSQRHTFHEYISGCIMHNMHAGENILHIYPGPLDIHENLHVLPTPVVIGPEQTHYCENNTLWSRPIHSDPTVIVYIYQSCIKISISPDC